MIYWIYQQDTPDNSIFGNCFHILYKRDGSGYFFLTNHGRPHREMHPKNAAGLTWRFFKLNVKNNKS